MTLRLDFLDKWTVDKYRDVSDTDEQWKLKKSFMLAHCESYPVERLLYWTQIFCDIVYRECTYPAAIMTQVEKLSRTVFTSEHAELQTRFYRLLVDVFKSSETKSHTETSKYTSTCDNEDRRQSKDCTPLLAKRDHSSLSKEKSATGDWDEFNSRSNEDSNIKKGAVPQDFPPIKDNNRNSVLDTALNAIYGGEGYLHDDDDDDDDDDYCLAPNLKCSPATTPISFHNSDNSSMNDDYKNVEKGSPVLDYDRRKSSHKCVDSTIKMRDGDLTPEKHRQSRNKSPISDCDKITSSRLFDDQFQSQSSVSDYERGRSTRMHNLDLESNVLNRDDGINPDHFDCEIISSGRQSKSPSPMKDNRQWKLSNHDRGNTSKIYDKDYAEIFSRGLDKDLSSIECEFSQKRVDKSPETKRISYPMLSELSLDILSKLKMNKKKLDELYKEIDYTSFPLGLGDKEDTSHETNYNEMKSDRSYKKEDKHTSRARDRDSPRRGYHNRKDKSPERYHDGNKSRKMDGDNDRDERRKEDDSSRKSLMSRHDRRDSSRSKKRDDDERSNRRRDGSTHESQVSRHKRDSSRSYDEERRRKQSRHSPANLNYNHRNSREKKSPVPKYDRGYKISNQESSTHSRRHSNSDNDEKYSRKKRTDKDSESHRHSHRDRKCEEHPEKLEATKLNKPDMSQATEDTNNHSSVRESRWSGVGASMNFNQTQPNVYQPQPNVYHPQPNFHQPLPNFHQYQPNYHYNQHGAGWAHTMLHPSNPTLDIAKPDQRTLVEIEISNDDDSKQKKESSIVRPSKSEISSISTSTQLQKTNSQTLPIKTVSSASTQMQRTDEKSKGALSKAQHTISKAPSQSKPVSPITAQEKKSNNEDLSKKSASAAPTHVLIDLTDASSEVEPCEPSVVPSANSKVDNNTSNVVAVSDGGFDAPRAKWPRIEGPKTQGSSGEAFPNTSSNTALPQDNLFFINQLLSKLAEGSMNSCPNLLQMLANPLAPSISVAATGLSLVAQIGMQNQSNQISQMNTILSCGRIPLNFNPPVQGMTPNAPIPSSSNYDAQQGTPQVQNTSKTKMKKNTQDVQQGTDPKIPQLQNTSKTKKKKKKNNTEMSNSSSTSQTTSGQVPKSKPTVTVPPNNNKRRLADSLGKAPECVITLDDDTSSSKVPKLATKERLSGNIDWRTALPTESVRFYTEAKVMPCLKTLEEITLEDIRLRTGPLNSVAILYFPQEKEATTLKRLNFLMDNIKLEVLPSLLPNKEWSCCVIARYTRTKNTQVISEAHARTKLLAIKAVCSRVLWYLQHIYFTFFITKTGNCEPSAVTKSTDKKSTDHVLSRFCQNGLNFTMPADFLDNPDTCTEVPFTTDDDFRSYSVAMIEYTKSFKSDSDSFKFLHFSPKISDDTTRSLIVQADDRNLQVRWKSDEKSGLVVYRITTKMYWNFCKVLFEKRTKIVFDLLRPHETTTQYAHDFVKFPK